MLLGLLNIDYKELAQAYEDSLDYDLTIEALFDEEKNNFNLKQIVPTIFNYVSQQKPVIVLDMQNIAMKHGKNQNFSCGGIVVAVNFWVLNGHSVVGFMPEYLLDAKKVAQKQKEKEFKSQGFKKSKLPDDLKTLKQLSKMGLIIDTPSSNYDDSYCIEYAKTNNGFIVTNDKFKDYIQAKQGARDAKNWIQSHSIGFTFHGDTFLPNPDDVIFKKFDYHMYTKTAKGEIIPKKI